MESSKDVESTLKEALERWKKALESNVPKQCPRCGEENFKLRESGLCVTCDPWEKPKDKKKTVEDELTEVIDL